VKPTGPAKCESGKYCVSVFQPLVGEDRVIVDLACGYGEFINNILGRKKYAVDLNPDARGHLGTDVEFCLSRADTMTAIADASVDVVFASNFLEHLRTKDECDGFLPRCGASCARAAVL